MLFKPLKKYAKWALPLPLLLLTGCSAVEYTIDRSNPWNRYFVGPLSDSLDYLAGVLFDSYGLALLVLTIVIRILILPLTLKQYKSSKQMQILQPELKKIREKYANNPQKQQEETMKLFQKHGVNPLSGCLPILIQMPILIALYNAIIGNPHIREHNFLWMQLGEIDQYYVLPVLAAITTYLQQKMMQSQMPANMQSMLIIFPILILVMSLSFPSALVLYWVYSNLFTMVQTYFLYKPGKPEAKGEPAK